MSAATRPTAGALRSAARPGRRAWPDLLVLGLVSAAFFACAIAAAHRKPFWHDEIFTLLLARLPSLSTIWRADLAGVDLAPPLNTLLTHAVRSLAGDGPVVTRIPAMAGVWLACLAMFAIVRRRSNLALGACAAMLPLSTAAFRYSVEARGYGLMLGLFALAAFAWTEAARDGSRRVHLPLLAAALAAGVWAHYYALLNAVPLVLGQLVRDGRRRKVDWPIWAAFGVAGLLVLPLGALLASAVAHRGRSWTLLAPAGIADTYTFLLDPLIHPGGLALLAALALLARLAKRTAGEAPAAGRIPVHETVAGVACLLIPLAGVLAGGLGGSVFTPRYALGVVVGAVPVVLLGAWVVSRRSSTLGVLLCAYLAFGVSQAVTRVPATLATPPPDPVADRPALRAALHRGETVCVTGGLMYLQLWYYTPPMQRARLSYLVDAPAARRITGTDSLDVGIAALARWTAVGAWEYDRFVAAHPRFSIYGAGSGWLLQRLSESGADVRETGMELGARIYDVTR